MKLPRKPTSMFRTYRVFVATVMVSILSVTMLHLAINAYLDRELTSQLGVVLPLGLLLSAILGIVVHTVPPQGTRRDQLERKRLDELTTLNRGLRTEIDQHREIEEALILEKRFSDAAIDNMPGLFFLLDEDGAFVRWNANHERATGYSNEETASMHAVDFVAEEDREFVAEKIAEVFTQGSANGEASLLLKNGDKVPYYLTGVRTAIGNRVYLLGVSIDISERKRMEDELRAAKEAAESATRAKSRFLAVMSHEIRTPMTAILGYSDLMLDPQLDADTRQAYLATVRRSGEHLLLLINDILDLSKIEAGKLALDMGRCNVAGVLTDVASMMRPRAEARGTTLLVEYANTMPESIWSDSTRLRQMLVNLVGNAVKFTENGTIRLRASFAPASNGDQSAVRIEVIDTGIGIHEELLPRLFQPFAQIDSKIASKYGGTGLGLFISHQIARALGGHLTVTSHLGHGSAFTLTVPTGDLQGVEMLQRPAEPHTEQAPTPTLSIGRNLSGVRVLLAEDGFDNQRLISTVLRHAGAEVKVAENGRIAVEMAEAESFDVILMDMNMPEMDGEEATRLLRSRNYQRPILAITAATMANDVLKSLAAGCDDHLAKPIDLTHLIHTVERYSIRAESAKCDESSAWANCGG